MNRIGQKRQCGCRLRRQSMLLVFALVGTWLVSTGVALAGPGPVSCGDTITADIKLESDLYCASTGLVVGADGITIDLNGHVLAGPGFGTTANGIHNVGFDDTTVRDGTITGFLNGVALFDGANGNTLTRLALRDHEFAGINLLNDSDGNEIRRVTVEGIDGLGNGSGIWLQAGSDHNVVSRSSSSDNAFTGIIILESDSNRLHRNVVSNNPSRGISLWRSTGTHISSNVVTASGSGILLHGASDGNHILKNRVADNAFQGIAVGDASTRNDIERNVATGNNEGITVGDGSDGNLVTNNILRENAFAGVNITDDSNENTVVKNRFWSNGRGVIIQGRSDTNVISRNVITESFVDHAIAIISGSDGNTVSRNWVSRSTVDGIRVVESAGTDIYWNVSLWNGDDGINTESAETTLTRNRTYRNGDLGIDAVPGVTDGGGNRAAHNGNATQCTNVACKP